MLITIEDLDGAGKTTICEYLAAEYGWINISSNIFDMKSLGH